MSILFLAHRLPFPPDRGDRIRAHHLLRALAKLAPVHVGCFLESPVDRAGLPELEALAASHHAPMRDTRTWLAGLRALARGRTVSETAFDSAGLRRWAAETVAREAIDTIVVFSGQMGQFVPPDFDGRLIVDLCDVDSAKFEAYAASGSGPRRWIDAREGRLLRDVEARLASQADCTLLVSEEEAALLRSRLPTTATADVRALRNGIDHAFFDPQAIRPNAELAATPGPHLVFTGQMDYAPNVAAVQRAATAILPQLRRKHPQAAFHIVGRAPTAGVRALERQAGVRVWGEVPDVRPFLRAADIVLAPLTIARGVQNKVLEAMAMARPVVLSEEAATGIAAQDGKHWRVAQDDEAMIAQCDAVLADPNAAQMLACNARRFVVERQGWDAMLAPLAAIVGANGLREDRRDAA